MAEAGDTDPASLAGRLNLTMPARVMLVYSNVMKPWNRRPVIVRLPNYAVFRLLHSLLLGAG
jgi:hypothetical protein